MLSAKTFLINMVKFKKIVSWQSPIDRNILLTVGRTPKAKQTRLGERWRSWDLARNSLKIEARDRYEALSSFPWTEIVSGNRIFFFLWWVMMIVSHLRQIPRGLRSEKKFGSLFFPCREPEIDTLMKLFLAGRALASGGYESYLFADFL